jgi:hypothetical protein
MNDYKKGRAEAGLGRMAEGKKAKPDFLDIDKDKNKKEPFKKAVADKKKTPFAKKVEEAKAKPDFLDIDKDKNKKEPFKKAVKDKADKKVSESKMSELDAALKDKNYTEADFKKQYGKTKAEMKAAMKDKPDTKKKVDESVLNDSTGATLDHICKTFSREVADFKQTGDMDEDLFQALYDYYFDDMPYGVKKARSGDPYEWVSDRFQEDMPLEEGTKEDFTTHGMDSQPSKVMPMPTPTKPTQTPWSRDPIAALTDRVYDKFSSKPKTPQFESWSTQLDSLLNEDITEGMTVSISKGQQGSPDSVSINAQDAEADQLLALVKSAGLGLFGGDDAQAPGGMNMSSAPGGEAGAVDVEVVDDHDDMLSLIRKMTGQAPAQQASSEDYADEEGAEEQAEEVCGDCGHSECECETEEVVDETETEDQREFEVSEDDNVAQAGAQEAGEDSALAAADGQAQSAEEDEPEEEEAELEESFANSEDDKFQTDIDFMTNVITGGLNRQKRTQSVGNPVTIASTPMKESADLLSDFRKLSGL